MRYLVALAFTLLAPLCVRAEMEKLATPCETQICFSWWPKLPVVTGWHHDRESSLHFGFNAQAPEGKSFGDAEAVIYANAPFKPRMPEVKNLKQFIRNDHRNFKRSDPKMKIEEISSLVTADGQKLHTYRFTPSKSGSFEIVSYGEEGEFYLVFTLSSRTNEALLKAQGDYEKFIVEYKSVP